MKTVIQIIDTVPYRRVQEFDFLYTYPYGTNVELHWSDKTYSISSIEDVITEEGITRYIRFI